jgi:hypothetical protein
MFLLSALSQVASDASQRVHKILDSTAATLLAGLNLIPLVSAQDLAGYTQLNSSQPNYNDFEAGPVANNSDGEKVEADVYSLLAASGNNGWNWWIQRASQIRSGGNREYCVGNLSITLSGLGAAYQASASGATTLLTMLPTAGALIGAPSKELWVLYKLIRSLACCPCFYHWAETLSRWK